jgi:hypothetical protein
MQGTQDEPGISQFRRLCATRMEATSRPIMSKIDLSHSGLFILLPSMFCYAVALTSGETRMKSVFVIAGLSLLLVACNPTDPCRSHTDEASCVADKACAWKPEKDKCRTAKKQKEASQSEQTTPPANSGQPTPSTGASNYSLPSTETQPQPTYPEGGE